MGLPGMVLAPVLLHYIKFEASRIKSIANALPDSPPDQTQAS